MASQPPSQAPSFGVAKIVQLGPETLLVINVENGSSLAEGEVQVPMIEALPVETDITGAGICKVRASCDRNCVVRWRVE